MKLKTIFKLTSKRLRQTQKDKNKLFIQKWMRRFSSPFTKKQLPWHNQPSLYNFIHSNLDSEGKPTDAGYLLPDEEGKPHRQVWIPGARDGVFGYYGSVGVDTKSARKAADLVISIAQNDSLAQKVKLYNLLTEDDGLDYFAFVLEKITASKIPVAPHLHNYARWLAFESPDRGTVKFGLALLGIIGEEKDVDKIITLGKNEEFTLYSTMAIKEILDHPEDILWELAKCVCGWGRIVTVNELLRSRNPEIKKWLLREGFRNGVMCEYLAYDCAVAGDLWGELSKPEVDEEVLQAAGEIIQALIEENGPPSEYIDDYEPGAEVVRMYVTHVKNKTENLSNFFSLRPLKRFLENKEADWGKKREMGWTDDFRANLLADVNSILTDPKWKRIVLEKQHTTDKSEFWKVKLAASILKIDLWENNWKRLNDNPTESDLWENVMKNTNEERIDQIISLANEIIPLEKIATGPTDELLGFGEEFKYHRCLECLVWELGDYPQKGFEFIEAALRSPVIVNRDAAVDTLSDWGVDNWPEGTRKLLRQVRKVEPDRDTRRDIRKLLRITL